MAYVSNETKANIQAALTPVFKKYGIKATVARAFQKSALVVNVKSGGLDFGSTDRQVNVYYIDSNYIGKAKDFLNEVLGTIKTSGKWYDDSDVMTDYFNTAFYIDINVGKWNKPYILN